MEILLPLRVARPCLRHGVDRFDDSFEVELRVSEWGDANEAPRHIAVHDQIAHVGDRHERLVAVDGIAHARRAVFAAHVQRDVDHHAVTGRTDDAVVDLLAQEFDLPLRRVGRSACARQLGRVKIGFGQLALRFDLVEFGVQVLNLHVLLFDLLFGHEVLLTKLAAVLEVTLSLS